MEHTKVGLLYRLCELKINEACTSLSESDSAPERISIKRKVFETSSFTLDNCLVMIFFRRLDLL